MNVCSVITQGLAGHKSVKLKHINQINGVLKEIKRNAKNYIVQIE